MSTSEIRGSVQFEIDGSGLEARLTFSPQEEGEIWNREKISGLLSKHQINEGIDSLEIDALLENPPKQGPVTIIAAKGTPAVPPEHEKVEWDDIPVPDELKADADRFFAELGPPEIVQIRVEKIKKQKKVEKKQKLSFLPSKEEFVTVIEKKEIPVPVDVDPAVKAVGWVTAGQQIAKIIPGKPGKMGKDIYGTPLMPEEEPDAAVYPGKGVEKKKNDLVAAVSGFTRRGENWIEVVPYTRHSWSVHLSKDHATCFLDFAPGDTDAELPSAVEIRKAAEDLGLPADTLLEDEEILQILSKAKESGTELKDIAVSKSEDSEVKITVTDDKMKAVMLLKKGRGNGKPLSLKEVGTVLRESGVKGFNPEKVKADILHFYQSRETVLKDYILAEGVEAEKIEVPELMFTVSFLGAAEQSKIIPKLQDSGFPKEFPPGKIEKIAFTVRHQPVAHYQKAKRGAGGRDVFGTIIPGQDSPKPPVKLFDNLKEEDEQIVAETGGLLETGKDGETYLLRVVPYRDGESDVRISEDNLRAFLSVKPAVGAGQPVNEENIRKQIKEAGIVKGINDDVLQDIFRRVSEREEVNDVLFAEAKEPRHASRNQIQFLIEFASGTNVNIKKDGSADYKNLNKLTMVKAGDEIALLLPPEETGEDGWDLFGKTLTAHNFQGFDVEIGSNIKKEEIEGGGFKLIAECDGKLIYDKKTIAVQNVHLVEGNVGVKSGNIKFKGSVQIKGSIESGFSVISGGTIQVAESVEGALLSAEEDIIIQQGVKGAGKAVLRTKQNIKAGFIEQATLLAVKDVLVKNFCLRSTLKCNGKAAFISDKGHFVGGAAKCRLGMEVRNLGTESGVKTTVSFGQDYLIADQIELEEREIQKIKDKLLTFDVFLLKMEKQGLREKLEAARKEKFKLMKVLEKRSLRLFTFREKFEEHFPSEIKIRGTLYPGVVIESHGRYFEPKEPKKNICITFNQKSGQIIEKKLENEKN